MARNAPTYPAPQYDNPISPWWLVLLTSIASLLIGIMLFTNTAVTTLFLLQVLGWYWFFSGVMNLVMMFVDSRGWGWNLALGILGIIAGLYIINHPLMGGAAVLGTVVIVLGVQGILYGIIELAASFQGAGFGSLIMGIISIVFGIILLGNVLISAALLPWVVGGFAVASGLVGIWAAFKQKNDAATLAPRRA